MDRNDTKGILEARIRQMADSNYSDSGFSLEDFDPEPQEKADIKAPVIKQIQKNQKHSRKNQEHNDCYSNSEAYQIGVEEYENRFFINRTYDSRISFSMNRHTIDILRKVLYDMESRATLSSFIENILLDHLQTYRSLINEATADKIRKPTIPNI